MKRFTTFACLSLILVASTAFGGGSRDLADYDVVDGKYGATLVGEVVTHSKAQADTVYLMGGAGDASNAGRFQDGGGAPNWNGWYPVDLTAPIAHWNVNTYMAANLGEPDQGAGNKAWWCGKNWLDDCGTGDFKGYGNNWFDPLDWEGTVANAAAATPVVVDCYLNYDNEPAYDYLYLLYENGEVPGTWNTVGVFNGSALDSHLVANFNVRPTEYIDGNKVKLRWLFQSDGGWSDEDCSWTTMGAAQIDLIDVYFNGVQQGYTEDVEGPEETWQWDPVLDFSTTVGNFGTIWPLLNNIDPCRSNSTPVVAFIDNGVVVPGTGGYTCTSWCYGPNGFIVNPEGGLAGPTQHMSSEIWSPVLTWLDETYTGAILRFDCMRHEGLYDATSPGMFYVWHVRSMDDLGGTLGPEAIVDAGWTDDNFVYYGGPDWFRPLQNVTGLLAPGRDYVQLALGAYELGWVWGYVGTDGTPAPYFDNVAFVTYSFNGPAVSTREIDIANDNFPQIGTFDFGDLAANSVRFDMANNISPAADLRNDPGDSIIVNVVAVRADADLEGHPKLWYKLFPNTLFDPARSSGLPNEGWVWGDTTYNESGGIQGDAWNFDLPDTGFFFPGDMLHYYIEGKDNQDGDIGTTILPGDTTGFDSSDEYPNYNSSFTVHALPTFETLSPGDHPAILFWNDFANRGGENEWVYSLRNLGYRRGVDYDYFYTNGPSSGVGDGLGGRATSLQISGYETILYTSGDLSAFTISNGDFDNDAGTDVQVLDAWLQGGNKNMFMTGDDLVFDLQSSGTDTDNFRSNYIGVNYVDQDVRPFIDGQSAPTVEAIPGNSVFTACPKWVAYGGCIGFNTFDAVEVTTAELLAEFLDPDCLGGQYSYAAATRNINGTYNSDVIYMPYDFMFIYNGGCETAKATPPNPSAVRTCILEEILLAFGHTGTSPATPVPDAGVFSVKNFPNPFNPSTKILFNMPKQGPLSIKIYNVRGELVKTLVDEVVPAGEGFRIWDGDNNSGAAVASGVYFYETKGAGKTFVNKMALVK